MMNFSKRWSGCFFLASLVAFACSEKAGGADSSGDAADTTADGSSGGATSDAGSGGSGASTADGDTSSDGAGASAGSTPDGPRAACKRGVAYGHHSKADFAALSSAVAWWYNWYFQPDSALADGSYRDADVEYVPMYHHIGDDFTPDNIIDKMPSDSRVLLGFNEPNFKSQANLSAAAAAAAWPDVERIAVTHDMTIVSPAVNYCGPAGDCWDTDPLNYLEQFFAACGDCRVDRIAFHVYVGCNPPGDNKAQWLIDHVENYKARFPADQYGRFWLTEFACNDATSFDQQKAFLEDAVAYLEGEPRIERYAWFSGRADNMNYVDLFGADGQLTALGVAYRDAAKNPDCP